MLTVEKVVLPSHDQFLFALHEMRNPMNSWNRADSGVINGQLRIGCNDMKLAMNLASAGVEHRKFLRMLPVMMRINAPLYWWKEFDTYKVGTTANSQSTMHRIHAKEFSMADFSCESLTTEAWAQLEQTIDVLNKYRSEYIASNKEDKRAWMNLIQLLPSSYNQTRGVSLNYEVLGNIYRQRRYHKLQEWYILCDEIETIPYSKLIIGDEK